MSLSKNSRVLVRSILIIGLLFVIQMNLFAAENLLQKKISLKAEDATISQVLTTMANLSKCNIVLAMDVAKEAGDKSKKGNALITIDIKDMPVEEALSVVVKSSGLTYRLIGDKTFIVGDKANVEKEIGERTYVITLNNTNAKKLEKALKIMPGEIKAIEGQNKLLVVANPQSYADILKRIEEIDVAQKQIEISARLYEVNVTESEKIGIDWSRINHLTTIIAENPTNAAGVGLPYSYSDETGAIPHGNAQSLGELPESQYFQKMTDWNDVGRFSRQLYAFDITLDFLLSNNAAKVLTDTRLTAKDGEEASIVIGEKIPWVSRDTENEYSVEEEEIGIKLTINPTVNKNGMITTKIMPEVSSLIDIVAGQGPHIKLRKLESTVTAPSGSRIIVGGLLSSQVRTQTNKVPFLGNIPWIGRFFRHKEEVINNSDLIIELTPKVVSVEDMQLDYEVDKRLERKLISGENAELKPAKKLGKFDYNLFK